MRLLAVCLVVAACSSGSMPAVDAGASLPDGTVPAVQVRCDVVNQGCPTGQRCDFTCENGALVIACITAPATGGQVGASCAGSDGGTGTGSSCAAGTGCFGNAGKPPMCYRYCKAGSECPMGTTCNTTLTFRAVCPKGGGNLPIGLCL